ncbi:MAG: hypothetical protein IJW21_01190 [Clostridia bacterium]|nr:hypothetical protein [Clostridia bacterium]
MIDKTEILYTFKKSFHISYNKDYFCCVGSNVNLYDFNSGEFVSGFKGIKQPNYSRFTSNKNLIVKTTDGNYHIYDLVSNELVKIIPPPKKVLSSITSFQVTPDDKYIIDFSYIFPTYKLVIGEIETGEYKFLDIGYARIGFIFKAETDFKYYVVTNCAEAIDAPDVSFQEFYELTYTAGSYNLKKLFSNHNSRTEITDYSSNKFAVSDHSNNIKIFDTQGNLQDELEYNKNGVLYDLKLSANGRYIALAESKNVYVYDLMNKECVKSYEVEYGCFVDFIDDTKLLIGTWKNGYCVSLFLE